VAPEKAKSLRAPSKLKMKKKEACSCRLSYMTMTIVQYALRCSPRSLVVGGTIHLSNRIKKNEKRVDYIAVTHDLSDIEDVKGYY
jgi:hypothetical protein